MSRVSGAQERGEGVPARLRKRSLRELLRRGRLSERVGVRGRSPRINFGAGNGIRTRDFDLGKVALYH
jgi:hypothetical protein